MTVAELIAELSKFPQDLQVILQADSEGNGYSPLSGVYSNGIYKAANSYSGYIFDSNWTAYNAGMDAEEWDEFKKTNPKCCLLCPIN